jgi:Tol biopolymer transport system component
VSASKADQLAIAPDNGSLLVERDGTSAEIVRLDSSDRLDTVVEKDAQQPALSADGRSLAYVRTLKGRGSLWIRDMGAAQNDMRVTGPELDVYDIRFGPAQNIVFSAADMSGDIQLYQMRSRAKVESLGIRDARYPSISPDGKWLAYSALKRGVWHLTLHDLNSGVDRQLGTADCNDFSPAWQPDSRTLLYVSDCGRGLWQTSLYRRTVLP